MSNLTTYIKSINKASRKEMADNPDLWIGKIVEDPEHWESYGIFTPAEFDRYQDEQCLYNLVSDEYSKSYARSIGISSMSEKELQDALDEF